MPRLGVIRSYGEQKPNRPSLRVWPGHRYPGTPSQIGRQAGWLPRQGSLGQGPPRSGPSRRVGGPKPRLPASLARGCPTACLGSLGSNCCGRLMSPWAVYGERCWSNDAIHSGPRMASVSGDRRRSVWLLQACRSWRRRLLSTSESDDNPWPSHMNRAVGRRRKTLGRLTHSFWRWTTGARDRSAHDEER